MSETRAMNSTEYSRFVQEFWFGAEDLTERKLRDLYIISTGLGGETGEVLEKLKKYVRDGARDDYALRLELGDVLYYLTAIALAFGMTLDDVLQQNVAKLKARRERGTMRGSGDER